MIRPRSVFTILLIVACASGLQAQDYRMEPLAEAPPADELSAEILDQLSAEGARVIRGEKSKYCDIWLCKELTTIAGFEATPEVLYPFTPGQLVGAIRFSRRGADFRDQRINRGVYTLRYAQQPVDGAHVGTSLTRDFLLVISAEQDKSAALLEYDSLTANSAKAVGTSHPGMLSLQRIAGEDDRKKVRHDEDHDWWIVPLESHSAEKKPIHLDLVVVGVGEE